MSDFPTPKEELERKSVECLEVAATNHEKGLLSDRELGLIGHAVWSITCGLVDESVSELAAQVSDTRNNASIKRHFVARGLFLTLVWNPIKPGYVLVKRHAMNPSKRELVKTSNAEVGEREEEIRKLVAHLLAGGYIEL